MLSLKKILRRVLSRPRPLPLDHLAGFLKDRQLPASQEPFLGFNSPPDRF